MRKFIAAAAIATFAFAGAAQAEFFLGQEVSINGAAGPEFGGASWGTWVQQGTHQLGGSNEYWDSAFPQGTLPVYVDSEFVGGDPTVLSFTFDFGAFFPGDFTFHAMDIIGLKTDGSIIGVTASQGLVQTDGNNIHWDGSGPALQNEPDLKITVFQIPAPGALALVAVAGLVARRRRA